MASTGAISGIALMASGVTSFYVIGTQDSYATVEGIIAKKDIKTIKDLKGNTTYTYEGPNENPYYTEHSDLIASIREGKALNEAKNVAESTMCAVTGRMSAYTGRALKWDWAMNASKLDLRPAKYEFGDLPLDAVAIPGKTQLI